MPERTPVSAIPNLGELLRRRERRIIVIMVCFAVMLLCFAGSATYVFVTYNQRISDNKQNSAIAKVQADAAKDRARIAAKQAALVKAQAREADLRSDRTLSCLTKSKKPAQCLDIAAGRAGVEGGVGKDGQPGRQGIEGQRGQRGFPGATGATGKPGADGAPGRPPTAAEIEGAVNAYCSTHGDCAGPPGENTAVSPQQIASAVQAYCDSRGECKGSDGKDGAPGKDSTVPGPVGPAGQDAPPPTQEQVNAAVSAYCSANPAACQPPASAAPPTPAP